MVVIGRTTIPQGHAERGPEAEGEESQEIEQSGGGRQSTRVQPVECQRDQGNEKAGDADAPEQAGQEDLGESDTRSSMGNRERHRGEDQKAEGDQESCIDPAHQLADDGGEDDPQDPERRGRQSAQVAV